MLSSVLAESRPANADVDINIPGTFEAEEMNANPVAVASVAGRVCLEFAREGLLAALKIHKKIVTPINPSAADSVRCAIDSAKV